MIGEVMVHQCVVVCVVSERDIVGAKSHVYSCWYDGTTT